MIDEIECDECGDTWFTEDDDYDANKAMLEIYGCCVECSECI